MIRKLRDFDQAKFDFLVSDIRKSCNNLADALQTWKSGGFCTDEDMIQLRSWCKDGNDPSRSESRVKAREISKLVFPKVIDEYD